MSHEVEGKTRHFTHKQDSFTYIVEAERSVIRHHENITNICKPHVFYHSETTCGVGSFHPRVIQSCATIGSFTTFNGAAYVMTSCVASFISSQITTLEKQYGFSTTQSGAIMSINKVSYIFCVLIFSYLGTNVHRPRALALGSFIFGFSAVVCSLPHFLLGSEFPAVALRRTDVSSTTNSVLNGELCGDVNNFKDKCSTTLQDSITSASQQTVAMAAMSILVLGMALQGLGKGPRFSFAITYVDDNTEQVNTGFYTGMMITCSTMGPVLAYIAGGFFSQIYVTLEATDIDPRHPNWIGAWWLGYLVLGVITMLVALPLQCFPRRLPTRGHRHEKFPLKSVITPHVQTSKSWATLNSLTKLYIHMRDFLSCQYRLCKNPVFTLINVCSAFIMFGVSSQSYMAKYLELVFDLPTHTANYTMAFRSMLATALGTFLGGYLTRRFKMDAKAALRFTTVLLLLSVLATCMLFVFYCPQPPLHSIPSDYSMCNLDCQCSLHSYFPVCGADGWTYFSPCMAGCSQMELVSGNYTGCSCISTLHAPVAVSGVCPYGCSHLYYYVLFSALLSLLQTLTTIPRVIIFLRCVEEVDKPAALGLQSFTNSLFGYLAGELLFGYIIDGACSIWDVNCDVSGRCLLYDNDLFRVKLHGYVCFSTVMSLVCVIAAGHYARKQHALGDREQMPEKES